ncbi:DUF6378 domain-containing protein [Testudinibacter sp. P27/CKL/0425]
MENIKQLLNEREQTHGDFEVAAIDFGMMIEPVENADNLTRRQKYALTMIMVKITRILNGNSSVRDHWKDIAGYALLGGRLENKGDKS